MVGDAGGGGGDDTSSSSFVVIDDAKRPRHARHHHNHFARALDAKLKGLQHRRRQTDRRPVFVTTVKTGIFLDPPPDLAALLGLDGGSSSDSTTVAASNRYYSYSSKPRVLYDKQHQRVAPKTRPDMCKQMGYPNIMHDKRVVRGSNFAKKAYFGKESPGTREAEVHRRTVARRKAMDYQTKALRLHLGAPKLTKGRQDIDIQTDKHLEELYEYPQSQTSGTQTELDQDLFSHSGTVASVCANVSTQVDEKELFDFDTMVTPIAEELVVDALRQAMREVLYEDELDARARQQRALYLRHTIEAIEKQRLDHEEERLNKVVADHTQWFDNHEQNEKSRTSESFSDRVTILLPEVINDLNQKGFDTNSIAETTQSPEFLSWLMEELQSDRSKRIDSNDILKSIIHDLVKSRLDNEVTDVLNIRKPEELFKEIESVTLQSDHFESDHIKSNPKNETDSR